MFTRIKFLLGLLFCLAIYAPSWGTHLRAGEITVRKIGCTGRTYEITVTVYIDTESGIQFGGRGEILNFGDSSFVEVPETPTIVRSDLGKNMGMASYTISHTYAGPGSYIIRYTEPNRNEFVLNMANSVQTLFYLETKIVIDPIRIDPVAGCNYSPRLLVPPIDGACTGAAWFHNPGAYDPDGDSLSYELSKPKRGKGTVVTNYRDPDTKEFYDRIGLDYNTANEAGLDKPSFEIDSRTGTLTWDAPGAPGEYNIAFLINEWRKIGGVWIKIGYVVRDMQIIVEDCNNQRPELEVPQDICVEAGTLITQDIFGFDPDGDSVKIEAFSGLFEINPNPASMVPNPAPYQASSPVNKARTTFLWQTDCEHVQAQPYQVVFKVTDKPLQGPKLVQFKTWNITVVGPAPKWESATLDPGKRAAALDWENYACANAITMQVWRRVDHFEFEPPKCVTGMPDFLGFQLIKELPLGTTQFVDTNGGKGLAVGAQYCYRLVAVFPLPGGGESYVSKDICLDPILADAPVITHVSVDKTDPSEGSIRVRWRPAFELDKAQFPPPYSYEVYRAEGFSGDLKITKPHPGRLADTTYLDGGLNTEEVIYNYRIVLYDGTGTKVDTSYTASSVRLEAKPEVKQIALAWNADVPWSNETQAYPMHLIYRGAVGTPVSELTLIDSVNVGLSGFRYTDAGQYKKTPLKESETYCYRVMTRGAYGNPRIVEPLKNFSQVVCSQVDDKKPPCVPQLNVTGISCEQHSAGSLCGIVQFSNVIKWNRPSDAVCRADTFGYRVYIANKIGEAFTLYADGIRDTFFVDSNENLKSFARCYKVTAVDRAGNESELSEQFCFDNCPYYELPNVFTPNGDDCNERFSAYGDPERSLKCGQEVDPARCARFVLSVDFVVYNRWGKEVYRLPHGKERSIYIRWNGRDNEGKELAAGIYYYKADVVFNTVDPSQERKEIKGWVHLLRTTSPN